MALNYKYPLYSSRVWFVISCCFIVLAIKYPDCVGYLIRYKNKIDIYLYESIIVDGIYTSEFENLIIQDGKVISGLDKSKNLVIYSDFKDREITITTNAKPL